MGIDNVEDLGARVQYVASAAQTDFDYPFAIFTDADLVVDIDGTTKALSTDYTVSGAGADTGGTVTLLSALTGGEIVTIYRDIAIERLTDIQQNGPWSSTAYNDEQDKTYLLLQQLDERCDRSLRLPITAEVASDDIVLEPANYASKYLAFDSDGKPTPAALSSSTMTQSTIGQLFYPRTAAEISAGVTPTYYYYEPGDVRRYGADDTGTNYSDDAFADAFLAYSIVTAPRGTYKLANSLVLASGDVLRGEHASNLSASNTTFINSYATDYAIKLDGGSVYLYTNQLENISIFAKGGAVNTATGVYARKLSEFWFRRVYCYGFNNAFELRDVNIGIIDDPTTSECNYGFYFTELTSTQITIRGANCWKSAYAAVSIRASVNHLMFNDSWFEYFKYGWEIVPTSGSQLGVRMFVNDCYVNTADSGLSFAPVCVPVYVNLGAGSVPLYSEHIVFRETLLGSPDSGSNTSVITVTGTAGSSTMKNFTIDNCILSGGNTAGIETTLDDIQWELRGNVKCMSAYYGSDISLFASAPSKLADYRVNQTSTWTPTWTGSGGNPSIGDGVLTGRYQREGKIIDAWISVTMGSSTTYGSGTWNFDLPVGCVIDSVGEVYMLDSGTTNYTGVARVVASTDLIVINVHNNASNVGPTVPHTWATGDQIWIHVRYLAQT